MTRSCTRAPKPSGLSGPAGRGDRAGGATSASRRAWWVLAAGRRSSCRANQQSCPELELASAVGIEGSHERVNLGCSRKDGPFCETGTERGDVERLQTRAVEANEARDGAEGPVRVLVAILAQRLQAHGSLGVHQVGFARFLRM